MLKDLAKCMPAEIRHVRRHQLLLLSASPRFPMQHFPSRTTYRPRVHSVPEGGVAIADFGGSVRPSAYADAPRLDIGSGLEGPRASKSAQSVTKVRELQLVAAQVGIRWGGQQQEIRRFYIRVYYKPALQVTARSQRRLEKRAAFRKAPLFFPKIVADPRVPAGRLSPAGRRRRPRQESG